MSTGVLILGESGAGKSTSLRNLKPEDCALIQCIPKRLPFKGASAWDRRTLVSDDPVRIIKAMKNAKAKVIIIDDFQYLMANAFMRRASEKGYEKFTEIGKMAWDVLEASQHLAADVRVYILSHTETTDQGRTKMKTIGKMLDDKVTLEGMFTIVLRTIVTDGANFFTTKNSGNDTVKAPMGLFDDEFIENDLAVVDEAITTYYEISTSGNNEAAHTEESDNG